MQVPLNVDMNLAMDSDFPLDGCFICPLEEMVCRSNNKALPHTNIVQIKYQQTSLSRMFWSPPAVHCNYWWIVEETTVWICFWLTKGVTQMEWDGMKNINIRLRLYLNVLHHKRLLFSSLRQRLQTTRATLKLTTFSYRGWQKKRKFPALDVSAVQILVDVICEQEGEQVRHWITDASLSAGLKRTACECAFNPRNIEFLTIEQDIWTFSSHVGFAS